jgi:hypothetical protein
MTKLRLFVTNDANDGHAIERPKGVCHIALILKLLLAAVTPRLQVIRIAAVLYEASWSRLLLQEVGTENGRHSLSVGPTADHHWFSSCHVSCAV